MSYKDFIVHNFVLLCLALVMLVNAFTHFNKNKKVNIYSIVITLLSIALSVLFLLQENLKIQNNYYGLLTVSIIGYSLRPFCLYFFLMMNKNVYRGKYSFLLWLPLVINVFIYLLAYIPNMQDVLFGYKTLDDGSLLFVGGPLRFTSHIISAIYLAYLIYISVFTLKSKHFSHGIIVLICSLFTIGAVVIESFSSNDQTIEILNATIMVSTITYYLFLYKESSQIDALTGLFNRETFNYDAIKMTKTVTGVIHFDINGLKYLNDNFSHEEGDKAISTIASLIDSVCTKGMYAYRMGGDEFLILADNTTEKEIVNAIDLFKEKLGKTKYYCSVGYSFKKDKNMSFDELIKEAEICMYKEKNKFYNNSPFERRKS